MDRPFPPTPRRRALARAAGVVLDSPTFAAAAAFAVGVLALAAVVASIAASVSSSTRATLAHATDEDAVQRVTHTSAASVVADVLAAAGPVLLAAAVGAVAATAALTRSLFIPRRRVPNAPSVPPEHALDAALGLARGAVIAAVGATFMVTRLPALLSLATFGDSVADDGGGALRVLVLSALAHVAVAGLLVGAVDVVVRQRRLAGALRMTAREARDDARQSGGDPQARRRIRDARAHAHDPRERLRDAALVLVGGDIAVALRWRPGMDVPVILMSARGLAGRQLVAAARHLRIPSLADDALASSIVGGITPAHHAALARALAAIA